MYFKLVTYSDCRDEHTEVYINKEKNEEFIKLLKDTLSNDIDDCGAEISYTCDLNNEFFFGSSEDEHTIYVECSVKYKKELFDAVVALGEGDDRFYYNDEICDLYEHLDDILE